mmetsp:Transcript_8602/g.28328  ORF Transcript_8602/g.28328 Transcript_8602/m.28328 type:complete len:320 (-) Transcript_8602:694-1653(-)
MRCACGVAIMDCWLVVKPSRPVNAACAAAESCGLCPRPYCGEAAWWPWLPPWRGCAGAACGDLVVLSERPSSETRLSRPAFFAGGASYCGSRCGGGADCAKSPKSSDWPDWPYDCCGGGCCCIICGAYPCCIMPPIGCMPPMGCMGCMGCAGGACEYVGCCAYAGAELKSEKPPIIRCCAGCAGCAGAGAASKSANCGCCAYACGAAAAYCGSKAGAENCAANGCGAEPKSAKPPPLAPRGSNAPAGASSSAKASKRSGSSAAARPASSSTGGTGAPSFFLSLFILMRGTDFVFGLRRSGPSFTASDMVSRWCSGSGSE